MPGLLRSIESKSRDNEKINAYHKGGKDKSQLKTTRSEPKKDYAHDNSHEERTEDNDACNIRPKPDRKGLGPNSPIHFHLSPIVGDILTPDLPEKEPKKEDNQERGGRVGFNSKYSG
jgi:hypothetical protein